MRFFLNSLHNSPSLSCKIIVPELIRFGGSLRDRLNRNIVRSRRSSRLFSSFSCDRKWQSLKPSEEPTAAATMRVVAESEEERVARRFWIKFRKEAVFAMYTPFVVGLASGKLEMDTFRNYLGQDVHFLRAFAQAYEMAEDCADDDDAKSEIRELRKAVMQELKMHDSFVKEWGFDPAAESTSNSATVKYTDFLLATASGKVEGGKAKIATPFEKTKVAAYTIGAMTPCMRLYAFLGKELQALMDPDDVSHPYKRWIDNYASEGFEASALKTEDLLDNLSISLTGEELEVIEKLYHQAMKLEIEFFSAQPITQQTIVPLSRAIDLAKHLVIFSDFDLTCTILDSSAILAEIAIITASRVSQDESENVQAQRSSADLKSTWGVLSKQYAEEYEQCIESALPNVKEEKFNYEGLCKALELISDFEKRANSRVVGSGVLKGINVEDVKRAGEHLKLQDGCLEFFQKIVNNEKLNADVHLLSYCWCGDLIRAVFLSGGLTNINIHANEFIYDNDISTGEILKKVESPMDKLQAFKEALKQKSENGNYFSVYIGDSVGDLLCLLEADVGIVVGSSLGLRRLGSQFGVSFVPLFSGLVKKQKEFIDSETSNWKGLSGILYTVSSWAEIHAFILGL